MKNFETSNVNKKMKLYIPNSMPLWVKQFWLVFSVILCAIVFLQGSYIGLFFSVFLFFFIKKYIYPLIKMNKWLKETMENDAFIQNNEFSMGSVGRYSMLMVSNQKLRVIVYKMYSNFSKVIDVYKNYPSTGTDIILNGINVYYLDIPLQEIRSITPISESEAGGIWDKINFGLRINTQQGVIYDVDTTMSSAYCAEINSHLIKTVNTTDSDELVDLEKLIIKDKSVQDRQGIKSFFKIIVILVSIIFLAFFCLEVMNEIDQKINSTIAIGISLLGLVFYILGKQLKKVDSLFIEERFGVITLSSPLYVDLFIILGGLLVVTGLLLNHSFISLVFNLNISTYGGGAFFAKIIWFIVLVAFFYYVYKRLRFTLFDKIVISKEQILFDKPLSKETILINKNEIAKIVDLNLKKERGGIDKSIEFYINGKNEIIVFDKSYFNDLFLTYRLFINSLNRQGYSTRIEILMKGMDKRFDESGNEVVNIENS
jgi:hypothetical protein